MKLSESIRISWRAITGHKLRSTLTGLGVIIGIGAVITFMVMGGGFEQDVLGDLETGEESTMTVRTQVPVQGGFGVRFSQAPVYTQSDVDAVSDIDGVEYVSPTARIPATQLESRQQRLTGGFSITATTAEQFETDLWEFVDGDPFEPGTNETIVTEPVVDGLDGELGVGDRLGIRFEDGTETNFTIAGVVSDQTGSASFPQLYVPVDPHYDTTIETPSGTEETAFSEFGVGVEDVEQLEEVKSEVQAYFEEGSGSDAARLIDEDDEIVVQTIDDVVDQITSIIDQFALFLGGIAAISLLVGSIGIANIMIVSVTERTREIGIMKAVGARKRDIMQLFLVESLILGIVGAVGGVGLGLGVGYLAVSVLGWPMAYPVGWIVIAVVVGIAVGMLSGLYPAWRAAKVDPIAALRHE
jgi:putative ABC transport system permease protein